MELAENNILYVKKGHLAYITLNRPEAGNSINRELAQELAEVCLAVNQDDDIYLAVLNATGNTFCKGGDGIKPDAAASVAGIDKPVIASINGDALGEGLELALACDIRLASDKARFGLPQITSGAIPMNGGTQRLPRLIGKGHAMELILTGKIIDAKEAFDIGLVSRVIPSEKLAAEVDVMAEKMAGQAPISQRFVKEAVNKGMDMTLEQGLRLEGDLYFLIHTTADRTEGIKSFLAKKKAEFKGR
jgi:enoyl-CoA hydratase/carnithine racemase